MAQTTIKNKTARTIAAVTSTGIFSVKAGKTLKVDGDMINAEALAAAGVEVKTIDADKEPEPTKDAPATTKDATAPAQAPAPTPAAGGVKKVPGT